MFPNDRSVVFDVQNRTYLTGLVIFIRFQLVLIRFNLVLSGFMSKLNDYCLVCFGQGNKSESEFENLKIWNKIKIFTFGVTAGYHGRMVRRKWKRKLERGNTYKTYQSYNIRVTLIWFKRFLFKLNIFQLDVPIFEIPLDIFQDGE